MTGVPDPASPLSVDPVVSPSVAPPPFAAPGSVPTPVELAAGPPPVLLSHAEPEWELAPPIATVSAPESQASDEVLSKYPSLTPEPIAADGYPAPPPAVYQAEPLPTPAQSPVLAAEPVQAQPFPPAVAPAAPAPAAPPAEPTLVQHVDAHGQPVGAPAPYTQAPASPPVAQVEVPVPVAPIEAQEAPTPERVPVTQQPYETIEGVRHPIEILIQLERAAAAADKMQESLAHGDPQAA